MKLTRLVGFIFVAVLAMSLTAVSAAVASPPEFNPGTLNIFTSESGSGTLETSSGTVVSCLTDLSTGEVTGPKTVGGVVVTFHNCSSKNSSEGCSVKSTNGPNSSLIITSPLDGELGSVKSTESSSGVGLLLLPTSGTVFVTLEGVCLPVSPSPVDGSVVGEVTPVNGPSSKDGNLIFLGSPKGKQKIKEIIVLGVTVKPTLKALGLLESNEITSDLILYTNPVIVT
jgi:hypothetical protein